MQYIKNFVPLRQYCKQHDWPRLPQWFHWIYTKKPIALECIKKIGGRYMLDLEAFQNHVKNASLDD